MTQPGRFEGGIPTPGDLDNGPWEVHPKDCLGCGGRGFWYSPDNGQTVRCLTYSPRAKINFNERQLETDRDIMRKVIDDLAFTLTKLCPFNAACVEIYPGVEAQAVVKLKSLEGEVQHYTAMEFARMAVAITSVFRALEGGGTTIMTLGTWLVENPIREISSCWCAADGDYVAFAHEGKRLVSEAHGESPAAAGVALLNALYPLAK